MNKEEKNIKKSNKKTRKKNILMQNIDTFFPKKHISFSSRTILYSIFFVVFLLASLFLFAKSFNYKEEKNTKYQENSYLDYKVYLKPNEFYETDYLDKNMIYIASLIKNIDLDFQYKFFIDEIVNLDFNYDIVGRLTISDESGSNVYFQKEYTLLENKSIKLDSRSLYDINEKLSIDYDYYNKLANDFKMAYGVEASSKLTVYLRINKKVTDNSDIVKLSQSNNMSITIPLSQRAININMDYTEINNSNYISSNSELVVNNYIFIVISVLSLVLSLVSLSELFKLLLSLRTKKSAYDKYINRILAEYDRLIVETESAPELEKFTIVKIRKFEELLDVRDNLKLPIMFYSLVPHHKGYFFIKHQEELYLYIVKSVDVEQNNNK